MPFCFGNDKPNTHAHHVSNYNHSCGYKHTYCSLKEHQPSSISQEIYHNLLFNIIVSIVFTIVIGLAFRTYPTTFQVPQDIFKLTYQFGLIILSVLTLTTCQMYIGTVLRVMNHAHQRHALLSLVM